MMYYVTYVNMSYSGMYVLYNAILMKVNKTVELAGTHFWLEKWRFTLYNTARWQPILS